VLALQGGVREHLQSLTACGATAVPVKNITELRGIDALVIPGGESTTIIKLAEMYDLVEPIRGLIHSGMPTLGSCAGMILLADSIESGIEGQETFGGIDMTVRRNAFGRQVESFEAEVSLTGQTTSFPGVFIRAPLVEELGSGVETVAKISSGPHEGRIVGVRQGHLMALAFHPELTIDTRVHQEFVDLVHNF
jgi:pyridoxal 5'-phosphate synthase pdxT subunit